VPQIHFVLVEETAIYQVKEVLCLQLRLLELLRRIGVRGGGSDNDS
jgi:hypothetical protein